ncbi:alpha/beta hydrolase [Oceanicella sp. SM1341]|uniref:alpha/beta hydrolase n=1 Tax=Oceanicella sp. SM1341 TaxID=1548889 RepID=UPI000E49A43D|nr:alpha/beta hydrolase [Oceanicella sp. SM1341]
MTSPRGSALSALARWPLLLLPALLTACTSLGAGVLERLGRSQTVESSTGIPYGDDPAQAYDLFAERGLADDAPLIVFFHGGSWDSGSPGLYAFAGQSLAALGTITALPGYRLAPDVTFPAFVEDGAAAVAAVKARYPGHPLYLAGHSAGAQIAALLALDPRWLGAEGLSPCRDVAGFIGLAGPYDFLPLQQDRYRRIFPEETRAESQPVNYAAGAHPPALILHGEADDVVSPAESEALAGALEAGGNAVTLRLYPEVGHVGIASALAPILRGRAPVIEDVRAFLAAPQAGCGRSPVSR